MGPCRHLELQGTYKNSATPQRAHTRLVMKLRLEVFAVQPYQTDPRSHPEYKVVALAVVVVIVVVVIVRSSSSNGKKHSMV